MAGFSAGDFEVQEDRRSDIGAVPTPTPKANSAAALSSVASAFGTASQGIGVLGQMERQEQASEREQARLSRQQEMDALKASDREFSNRYALGLDTIAQGHSSGQLNDTQRAAAIIKLKRQLINEGANSKDLLDIEAKTLKTVSGKALAESSFQDQVEDKENELYLNNPDFFLGADATPEQHEEQKDEMFRSMAEDKLLMEEKRKADRAVARSQLGSAEREEKEREAEEVQIKLINKSLGEFPERAATRIKSLHDTYVRERAELGEATARNNFQVAADKFFLEAEMTANDAASRTKSGIPIQKQAFMDTVTGIKEHVMANLGDARITETMTKIVAEQKAKVSYSLAMKSSDSVLFSVSKDLFGPQALVNFDGLANRVKADLNNMVVTSQTREFGGPPPNIEVGSEAEEAAFTLMTDNLKAFKDGKFQGDPESLERLVSAQLAHTAASMPNLNHKEINKLIEPFSTPEFSAFVSSRRLSNQDLDNLSNIFAGHKEDVGDGFKESLRELLRRKSEPNKQRTKRGRIAQTLRQKEVPEVSELDLVFESGQVRVKGLTPRAKDEARELNSLISGPFTRIVRVDANLSQVSQEEVFNSWKEGFWSEGEAEQEEVVTNGKPAQEEATQVDYSQYEGRTGRDQEGNIVTVRNGVLVKVGGTTDARESR